MKLIVWVQPKRKVEIPVSSHAEATCLARGKYRGLRCKIVNNNQRSYPVDMRSYSDKMAAEWY